MSEPEEVEKAKDCTCGHALAEHWPDEDQHHACDECECKGYAVGDPV